MSRSSEPVVHQNKTFSNIDYAERVLENREFIRCEFVNCDFLKSDLSGNDFVDCRFKGCNFSLTIVNGAGFRNASFTGCKILGIDFSKCNQFLFSFSFQECILDYSTFFRTKLKKTKFMDCSLKEVDFEEVDLTGSLFRNCDMEGTRFMRTTLEKADFSTSRNFTIDLDANMVKRAKFSALNLAGLLYKYNLDINFDD